MQREYPDIILKCKLLPLVTDRESMNSYCQIHASETLEGTNSPCNDCNILVDAIESLHQACMEQSKSDFLRTALYHFQRLLKAEYVLAGHLHEDGIHAIQTDLVLHKGTVVPNMEYNLKGTPCENVISRTTCVYPTNVADEFPTDTFFSDNSIEGYVGAPLIDQYYNMYGVLVGMTLQPMQNPDLILQLSKLFSISISHHISLKK